MLARRGPLDVDPDWPVWLCGLCAEPRSSSSKRWVRLQCTPCPEPSPDVSRVRLEGAPFRDPRKGAVCRGSRWLGRPCGQNSGSRDPRCVCWTLGSQGPSRQGLASPTAARAGCRRLGVTHVAVPQRLHRRQRPRVQRTVVREEAAPWLILVVVCRHSRQGPQSHGHRGCASRPYRRSCMSQRTFGRRRRRPLS